MVQRTVLKVEISCLKCKKSLIKAVAGLQGVDKVEVDVAKGTLSVTGDVDPYKVIVRTRKTGKFVEVVSVGPPPKPDDKKPVDKKPADKKPEVHMPDCCPVCQRMAIIHVGPWDETNVSCSVM